MSAFRFNMSRILSTVRVDFAVWIMCGAIIPLSVSPCCDVPITFAYLNAKV
jgi:hypothetical protein